MYKTPVSYICSQCDFKLWLPLAPLDVSTLGFYNDRRFPGRCILVLNEHFEEFADVPQTMAQRFTRDMQTAGRAIQQAVEANRINYAILGNTVSHLHCHLIPRRWPDDPLPERTPWETPLRKGELDMEDVNKLSGSIVSALEHIQRSSSRGDKRSS